MTTQVVNFLWLNLQLSPPPDPTDGSMREPMPEHYIDNIRKAAGTHPAAQHVL